MGPGGVVVLLVFGQYGAQVCLAEDEGPVEELPAPGADEALAERVHPRRLHRGAHDGGAGCLCVPRIPSVALTSRVARPALRP